MNQLKQKFKLIYVARICYNMHNLMVGGWRVWRVVGPLPAHYIVLWHCA